MTLLMFSLNTGKRVCWLDEICATMSGIGAVDVDANDFVTGHHDVVDRHGFQIDDSQQHVLAVVWECARLRAASCATRPC